MNPNECKDTITFAQYMENNLHLFCIGDCYVNLFPHFPRTMAKRLTTLCECQSKTLSNSLGIKTLFKLKSMMAAFIFSLKWRANKCLL